MSEVGNGNRHKAEIRITDGSSEDFRFLISRLDADLDARYGALQKQYDKHNKTDTIETAVVAYKDGIPAACGAFKRYDGKTAELKRVFVREEFRKQGLAGLVVKELERLASKRGYGIFVLETGVRQVEAIQLYKKLGYEVTDNYGAYMGNSNSVCMRKSLQATGR